MTSAPWPLRRRAVLAAALAVVAYNLPNFVFPFFEDTGLFAAIGHYMWHGMVPYRDLLDQKPPAIYAVTAATAAVFGTSSVASRVVELAFILGASLGVGALVREIDDRAEPAGIVICGALLSGLVLGLPERGQVEIYQAACLAWAGALLARHLAHPSLRRALGAGVLVGLACWFKPQGALFGLAAAALVAVWRGADRAWRDLVRDELALAAGAVAASLPFLLYLGLEHALGAFARVMFVDNRAYLTKGHSPPWTVGLKTLAPATPTAWAIALLAAVALGVSIARLRRERRHALHLALLVLWLGAALVQYYSGRYFFPYHRIVLLAPEAAFAALGLTAAQRACGTFARRRLSPAMTRLLQAGLCAALVVTAGTSAVYLVEWRELADVAVGSATLADVYVPLGREMYYFDFTAQRELARYIREHTQPGQAVQVLGRAGVFYLYVDRPPGSRYLVTSAAFDPHRPDRAVHLARFLADLRRTRPAYIIIRTRDRFPWFGLDDSYHLLMRTPEALAFVRENYEQEVVGKDDFIVLRRRDHR
jgi:4-amino-4-deoxy-L-arabinose transferase-like glycosyltransferase